jgi:hypothetical protein
MLVISHVLSVRDGVRDNPDVRRRGWLAAPYPASGRSGRSCRGFWTRLSVLTPAGHSLVIAMRLGSSRCSEAIQSRKIAG